MIFNISHKSLQWVYSSFVVLRRPCAKLPCAGWSCCLVLCSPWPPLLQSGQGGPRLETDSVLRSHPHGQTLPGDYFMVWGDPKRSLLLRGALACLGWVLNVNVLQMRHTGGFCCAPALRCVGFSLLPRPLASLPRAAGCNPSASIRFS